MANILLVEDDEQLQRMYVRDLTHKGHSVACCGTGKEALETLQKNIYDVILLDIMLPGGMNGFDILREVKTHEQWKSIPVIVMTNLESEKDTAFQMGAHDYFIKSNTELARLDEIIKKYTAQ